MATSRGFQKVDIAQLCRLNGGIREWHGSVRNGNRLGYFVHKLNEKWDYQSKDVDDENPNLFIEQVWAEFGPKIVAERESNAKKESEMKLVSQRMESFGSIGSAYEELADIVFDEALILADMSSEED